MADEIFYKRSFFLGHVQGVGFRSQVFSLAKGFDLTGYIKNLNDGRVELLAEGEELEVLSFVEAVKSELDIHIKNVEEASGISLRKYLSFSIIA